MIRLKDVPTGIISDLHIPGHVEGALEFVQETGEKWGIKQWVAIGDIVDYHYISRFKSVVSAMNPIDEFYAAKDMIAEWYKAFPELFICTGNHDTIPYRQLATLGIPGDVMLRSFNNLYNTPNWVWRGSYQLFDNTIVDHGLGSAGMYGAKNTANKLGVSYIQGHTHGHGGTFNLPRPLKDAAAMNVGCLMDSDKYFAAYGKQYKIPVSLGMGVALADDEMYFIKYKG